MKTQTTRNQLLLISDDFTVRESVGEILRLAHFKVALAMDGRGAVGLLSAYRVDAVVLDHRTPYDLMRLSERTLSPLVAITDIDPFLPLVLTCAAHVKLDLETTLLADLVLRHPVAPRQLLDGLHMLLTESMRERAWRKAHDSAALCRPLPTPQP
jgi:DNA-binding NtrC family response regulator